MFMSLYCVCFLLHGYLACNTYKLIFTKAPYIKLYYCGLRLWTTISDRLASVKIRLHILDESTYRADFYLPVITGWLWRWIGWMWSEPRWGPSHKLLAFIQAERMGRSARKSALDPTSLEPELCNAIFWHFSFYHLPLSLRTPFSFSSVMFHLWCRNVAAGICFPASDGLWLSLSALNCMRLCFSGLWNYCVCFWQITLPGSRYCVHSVNVGWGLPTRVKVVSLGEFAWAIVLAPFIA
jgi:hypothetical protein